MPSPNKAGRDTNSLAIGCFMLAHFATDNSCLTLNPNTPKMNREQAASA